MSAPPAIPGFNRAFTHQIVMRNGAPEGDRAEDGRDAMSLGPGKLGWDSIPFHEPLPLVSAG
jgi:hypothetical protein